MTSSWLAIYCPRSTDTPTPPPSLSPRLPPRSLAAWWKIFSRYVLFLILLFSVFFVRVQNPAEPGSSVALNNGGDWVTTAAIDAAQSFLASAVSAAANSRPWPPPESPSTPSSGSAWPASEAAAAPPPPPPPMNGLHGPPPGLATMMAAAEAAGAPPAFQVAAAGGQAGAPIAAADAPAAAAVVAAAAAAGEGAPVPLAFAAGNVPGGGRKSVLIHYEGYKSRYDEWITVQSPRLAPFRSRTSRPLSVTMQSVERVVNGASVRCVGDGIQRKRRVLGGGYSLPSGEGGAFCCVAPHPARQLFHLQRAVCWLTVRIDCVALQRQVVWLRGCFGLPDFG